MDRPVNLSERRPVLWYVHGFRTGGDSLSIAASGGVPGAVAPREAAVLPPGTPGSVRGPPTQETSGAGSSAPTGVNNDTERAKRIEGSLAGTSLLEPATPFGPSWTPTSTQREGATLCDRLRRDRTRRRQARGRTKVIAIEPPPTHPPNGLAAPPQHSKRRPQQENALRGQTECPSTGPRARPDGGGSPERGGGDRRFQQSLGGTVGGRSRTGKKGDASLGVSRPRS